MNKHLPESGPRRHYARPGLTSGRRAPKVHRSYRKPMQACAFDKLESCSLEQLSQLGALRHRQEGLAIKNKKSTGSTPWVRNCHELGGGASHRFLHPLRRVASLEFRDVFLVKFGFFQAKFVKPRWGRNTAGSRFRASPFGAKRPIGQPSHRSRKRQASIDFLALK